MEKNPDSLVGLLEKLVNHLSKSSYRFLFRAVMFLSLFFLIFRKLIKLLGRGSSTFGCSHLYLFKDFIADSGNHYTHQRTDEIEEAIRQVGDGGHT